MDFWKDKKSKIVLNSYEKRKQINGRRVITASPASSITSHSTTKQALAILNRDRLYGTYI